MAGTSPAMTIRDSPTLNKSLDSVAFADFAKS
jgi:hypothetical protein